ncbi:MAG: hypothetical protein ACFN4N_06545, partial [Streptococcus sp.]
GKKLLISATAGAPENMYRDALPYELTTIQQPIKEIAVLTVDLLLQKIDGQTVATTGYFLPVSLHSGNSV